MKFGEDLSNSEEMATVFRNSRRRRPQSLVMVNMHFRSDSCVLCQILNISTKFSDDWFTSEEMATDFRNSRWRRPPSWKIHFWLNRHYEKGTPGLLLPIENLTFWGLSWRLRVNLLLSALMLKRFPQQIGQVQKRVEILVFFGPETPKSEFEVSKPRKGTCTKQSTSFELSSVRIGWKLRPVGEMKKRKKTL